MDLSGTGLVTAEAGFITRKTRLSLKDPAIFLELLTHHSALLKNLKFAFTLPSQTAAPLGPSFSLQLCKLVHLTSLNLSLKTDSCIDLFISLGQSLSQLATLHLAQLPFGADQLLALILGSKHALLPPNFSTQEALFLDLQFTPESISPICSSLKHLIYESDGMTSVCHFRLPCAALVYRHFRNLNIYVLIDCKHASPFVNPVLAVFQPLHKKEKMNIGNRKSPRLLEKNTTTKSCKELGLLQWIADAPFNGIATSLSSVCFLFLACFYCFFFVFFLFLGHLNLTFLRLVEIRSRKMMQAVTSLCPNLRIVQFDSHRSSGIAASDLMSAQELKSMFTREQSNVNSCWSKVYFSVCNIQLCLIFNFIDCR